jgi:hypothetical protein
MLHCVKQHYVSYYFVHCVNLRTAPVLGVLTLSCLDFAQYKGLSLPTAAVTATHTYMSLKLSNM